MKNKARTTLKALLLALAWASPALATDPPQYTGTLAVTDVNGTKLFVNNRSGGDGLGFLARSVTITATGNTCFVDLGDTLANTVAQAGSPVATTADTPVVPGTPYVVNLGDGYHPNAGWAGLAGICSAGQSATWTITANRYDTPSVTVTSTGATVAGADKQIQFNDGGSALGGDARLTFDKTAGAFASTAPSTLGTGYGSDMVTNGTFTGNATGWTLGLGGGTPDWFYNANNVSHANGGGTATLTPTTPLTVVVGRTYRVSYTLSSVTAGNVAASIGGVSGTSGGSSGAFVFYATATTTANLAFTPTTTFVGTIDDVSVVESQSAVVANLTSGRIPFTGTGGRLQDNGFLNVDVTTLGSSGSANFTFRRSPLTSQAFLNVSGTLSPLTAGEVDGVQFNMTGSGSGNGARGAVTAYMSAGYTGNYITWAVGATNLNAGTGVVADLYADGFDTGIFGASVATSANSRSGVYGRASGSSGANFGGVFGAATATNSPALNVGVDARAAGATNNIAVYAHLDNSSAFVNPAVTAALVADNGAAAAPIALFRDNGTTVVTIADGGDTTFTARILSKSGTVASPGFGFTVDAASGTGFYLSNNGEISTTLTGTQYATMGTSGLRLRDSGAATNVVIGSITTAAAGNASGTVVAIGHNVSAAAAGAGATLIGNSVLASITGAANVVGIGSSLTIGNGGGACTNGIVIGQSHTCNVADSLVIGRGLVTSATGQAIIANSTTPYTDYIFGKGLTAASPPATITFHGTSSRPGTDNNVSGSGLIFTAGLGTGNSAVSSIVFKTPVAVGSGTGAQTETTQLTLTSGSATFVGSIFAPNGSTASPGLAFAADGSVAGSGFYLQNNGVIGMVSQGTEKIRMSGASVNLATTQRLTWGTAIGSADIGLSRDAAGILAIDGGSANTAGCTKIPTANGAYMLTCSASEILTLNTGATTTDTTANLLPADSIIDAVVTRVTTTITTAVSFSVGDPTTAARFSASAAGLSAGSTRVGLDHMSGAVTTLAAGPTQAAAAKVRITTNANPGAGVIRITVFYRQFVAPTS